jgi:hypothetical protein
MIDCWLRLQASARQHRQGIWNVRVLTLKAPHNFPECYKAVRQLMPVICTCRSPDRNWGFTDPLEHTGIFTALHCTALHCTALRCATARRGCWSVQSGHHRPPRRTSHRPRGTQEPALYLRESSCVLHPAMLVIIFYLAPTGNPIHSTWRMTRTSRT